VSGHHTSTQPATIAEALQQLTGLNPLRCYQCGKCSAGCPMAEEMGGLPPHALIRLVQTDHRDKLLKSEAIWLCLTCETCSARCPNDVQPARLIDGLRELALSADPLAAPRPIRAFHEAFLEQVRSHGRMAELWMIFGYKLGSGDLFSDALAAPGMLTRGKLKLIPQNIAGVEEVRRIFEGVKELEQAQASKQAAPPEGGAADHG